MHSSAQPQSSPPLSASEWNLRGLELCGRNQFHPALECFAHSIRLNARDAETYNNLAVALAQTGQVTTAIESLRQAVHLNPAYVEAHNNLGLLLLQIHQHSGALLSFNTAVKLQPTLPDAWNNRGNALLQLQNPGEALTCFDKALQLQSSFAEALVNRGSALLDLKRPNEALAAFDHAIELQPALAAAHKNRAVVLFELQQYEQSLASYKTTLRFDPDYPYAAGTCLFLRRYLCDWQSKPFSVDPTGSLLAIEIQTAALDQSIMCGQRVTDPFCLLSLTDSPALQRQAAEIHAMDKFPVATPPPHPRPYSAKIRIGYFSADFRDHPVSRLISEVFELHDRSRFEIYGFSFGPDTRDAVRARIAAAVDSFIDLRPLSDGEAARHARRLGIDIAIDLTGLTHYARTGIFAARAAPVQVNYLGYPGTMGASFMDYLIADPTLIPEQSRSHYTEKIGYLPDSYQANDRARPSASSSPDRRDEGLPRDAFVYCCFNNNYKITPQIFSVWMQVLRSVPSSVLWLLEDSPLARRNLQKEAAIRGIDPARLIFAPRSPYSEHLARQACADLFLDTLPYNAHTTASDALWCGLPLLTCTGESFAGRVATSLLNATNLPGEMLSSLIATDLNDYETRAIRLAEQPGTLQAIKKHLHSSREKAPIFDTPTYTRQLEALYSAMHTRSIQGLPPDHIASANSCPPSQIFGAVP